MLDRTTATHGGVPTKVNSAVQLFAKIRRRIVKLLHLEEEALGYVRDLVMYANANRAELLTSGKKWTLPDGSAMEWKVVGARMSCSVDTQRKALFALLDSKGLGESCISRAPQINESALREKIRSDTKLLEEILKVAPGFSLGREYEQVSISFKDMDKRAVGNLASNEFVIKPKE